MNLEIVSTTYRAVRERIKTQDPDLDEQTLTDTVEGLTDVHEILAAIVRAALADEALATGLKGRIAEMQERLERPAGAGDQTPPDRQRHHGRIGFEEADGARF